MNLNFGLGVTTGTEGLMYPIPYFSVRDVVELSVYAEKLGFHSVSVRRWFTTPENTLTSRTPRISHTWYRLRSSSISAGTSTTASAVLRNGDAASSPIC